MMITHQIAMLDLFEIRAHTHIHIFQITLVAILL
jgi:hypothetical protein